MQHFGGYIHNIYVRRSIGRKDFSYSKKELGIYVSEHFGSNKQQIHAMCERIKIYVIHCVLSNLRKHHLRKHPFKIKTPHPPNIYPIRFRSIMGGGGVDAAVRMTIGTFKGTLKLGSK